MPQAIGGPRDQDRDLDVAGRRYAASIGPDDSSTAGGWSWEILESDGEDSTVIDAGPAGDEHAAKAAVDAWEAARQLWTEDDAPRLGKASGDGVQLLHPATSVRIMSRPVLPAPPAAAPVRVPE